MHSWLQYICNCNNPTTKAINVTSLCKEVKGVEVSRVWKGVEGVEQTNQTMAWNPLSPSPNYLNTIADLFV